jgi:hypothetical protein
MRRCVLAVVLGGALLLSVKAAVPGTPSVDPRAGVDLAELVSLSDHWLAVHIVDGHVIHHGKGEKNAQERAIVSRIDAARAARPETWTITSSDDPAYQAGKPPLRVGRKTRGCDFAGLVEGWENGHTVNKSPDHALEHWIYLALPSPLVRGATYSVASGDLVPGGPALRLKFDDRTSRTEAVHVNLVGYPASSPAKFGYVYHWMGDLGGLEVRPLEGRPFRLIEQPSQAVAFTGKVAFRFSKEQPETLQLGDSPPHGNFLKADVCECDFSGFSRPGTYLLSVEGVGASFPVRIGEDVYREAFRTAIRGLYHNRSGIALVKPYTEFERPAPHNPLLTPGFKGKLVYTRSRYVDWKNGDHDDADRPAIEAGIAGPIEAWGWYQDAGDWDSYESHLNVPAILLLAYDLAPGNFRDGDGNIPESGNGVPDILDEAAWLPRFCHRLRAELVKKSYGTGGIGLRVCGDHFGGDGEGVPSYLDVNRQWIASGEDPWSTYHYAGVAAHLAFCLKKAGVPDPQGVDWAKEAKESWTWASTHMKPGDEEGRPSAGYPLRDARAYAASALFRLTGEEDYQKRFSQDTSWIRADTMLWDQTRWGPWLYVLGGGPGKADPEVGTRLRAAVLKTCRHAAIETPGKRALRWGGNWAMPMLVGQQTTPWILEGMVGHALLRESDPKEAAAFRAGVVTTCDYFLGTNSLNMTWVTGLGPRYPKEVFHLDAWCNGKGRPHPGIVPYGPWKKDRDSGIGPWDKEWAYPTLHPGIDEWPGNERWFENRCAPLTSEFTIHQNTVYAAATFGWLSGPAEKAKGSR